MNFRDIEHNEIELKKLTGLRKSEFSALHQCFDNTWHGYFSDYTLEGKPRKRVASMRSNSIFAQTEDALLFGLMYIKNKTLQEKLALEFGIDQPKASRYLNLIEKLIYQVVTTNAKGLPNGKRNWLIAELSM